MPWQDVHLQITGPAVADLARNFVWRWNSEGGSPSIPLPATPAKQTVNTGCGIQVLRSAPLKMRQAEYKALPFSARPETPIEGAQTNIADAMAILIDKAQNFIYIENQFFVSGFGVEKDKKKAFAGPSQIIHDENSGGIWASRQYAWSDVDKPPQNKICEQLATKINAFIMNHKGEPFHVYITLPVHPEGKLNDGSIMTQIHWTMQSLVFGTKSLLNRIRRSLRARDLVDQNGPDSDWKRAYADNNTEYESIDIKRCFEYVTLLNLRNHAQLGDRYVTEQIYVHSKMLIVDDLFAIVGSANINDRSLLGSRDSELAVLVMDTKIDSVNLCGDNKLRPTRGHARQLRMAVWNKLFGITAGGERAATELKDAVESPGAKASWEAIQKRAKQNTDLYEAAFDFIPRNKCPYSPVDGSEPSSSSIWPRWNRDPKIYKQVAAMPFEASFWISSQFNATAAAKLNEVKGFITLLPIEWTKGENNNLGYPTELVGENKTNANPLQQPTATAQADVSLTPTTEGST
jgi:phospholipase D1/2